MLNIAKGS